MDLNLTEEQQMLADAVRAFVEKELLPHELEVEQQEQVSPEIGQQITEKALELGLYAANLPLSVGGGGLDYTNLALLEREFGKVTHFKILNEDISVGCEVLDNSLTHVVT